MPSCASTRSMPSQSDAAAATAPALSASRHRSGTTSSPTTRTPDGDEQLNDELADEAEPDHARSLTELDLGATHCVHGDRSDGRERGVFRRDTIGDGNAEVARNPVDFRVQRMVVPRACHQLADGELVHVLTDFDDHTGERIPEGRVRVEPGDGASGTP